MSKNFNKNFITNESSTSSDVVLATSESIYQLDSLKEQREAYKKENLNRAVDRILDDQRLSGNSKKRRQIGMQYMLEIFDNYHRGLSEKLQEDVHRYFFDGLDLDLNTTRIYAQTPMDPGLS